jgi:hypothetical protein
MPQAANHVACKLQCGDEIVTAAVLIHPPSPTYK